MEPLAWHRHEMLFGFVGAAIAGFLLTAVPNWTGRLPIAGPPLAALFGLWLAARLALLFSAYVGAPLAAALDVGFYLVLAALAAREVLASRNRNLPVVGLILLFGLACAIDHAAAAGLLADTDLGIRFALGLVVLLISLTAGAMATMILAVMTRATLGHTGRELKANVPTLILFLLVTLGAVLRVSAGLGLIAYRLGLELAGLAWAGAFILFLAVYGPILFRARLGEG